MFVVTQQIFSHAEEQLLNHPIFKQGIITWLSERTRPLRLRIQQ